ncbi:bluf domain protein [Formosa agariphila KMM 3901]|uniref:Bluf domain protein n=1 Tax=Formosa agariphila (strain DSM 15362 / KCTC 12365 / LMG 23005 / KMM 3901 / M-2Alg 35-1) TaxID=1347342 RepID=T2KLW1_FORAG|nr:BLUF domain-containing protein [Formosa agariphila]CDF79453.1 bluf domain protein [Formosa agariphila KMM 3901]
MYQLNYYSKSQPGLSLEHLDNILETAVSVNAKKSISGCLIYHNNSFVQILEGEKKDVLEIFEKIKTDDRHHSIHLLWENHVDKRYFKKWDMAYYKPNDQFATQFVDNLLLLSAFSEKSSGSLMSFWGHVRRVLESGSKQELENV